LTYTGPVAPSRRRSGAPLPPPHDPDALNWLLRRSVRSFRVPVTEALRGEGFGDLPQQGIWALSVLTIPGASARDLVARMDITKQAVGQLVDTLVGTGYVERLPYPEDRRRTLLRLTARGEAAANVIADAVETFEAVLSDRIGADRLAALHRTLADLDKA